MTPERETDGQHAAGPGAGGVSAYGDRLAAELESTMAALRQAVAGAEPPEDAAGPAPERQRRYGFRIGGIGFLHDLGRPVELTEPRPPSPLPNTHPWCLGLVNLRGNLVPVYDPRPLLGVADPPPRGAKLLVIGSDDAAAGLIVDATPASLAVDPAGGRPVEDDATSVADLPPPFAASVRMVHEHAGERWLEIDYDRLFGSLARQAEL